MPETIGFAVWLGGMLVPAWYVLPVPTVENYGSQCYFELLCGCVSLDGLPNCDIRHPI